MRTRRVAFLGLALTAVLLTGCGGVGSSDETAVSPDVAMDMGRTEVVPGEGAVDGAAPAPQGLAADGKAVDGGVSSAVVGAVPPAGQQIVRTGSMSMTADDVTATAFSIHGLVNRYRGLISSEDTTNNGEMTYASITAQIPANDLDAFIAEVSKLGQVDAINVGASDVTAQVVDLDARIKATQASVDRMTQLLAQAQRMEDLLAIEAQLSARQAELDSLTAQRKYLADQVALSTISISVAPTPAVAPAVDAPGFWTGLQSGWAAFASVVLVAVTALGFFLPFLIVLLVIGIPLIAWAVRYSRRGRRLPPPPAEPEPQSQPRDLTPVG